MKKRKADQNDSQLAIKKSRSISNSTDKTTFSDNPGYETSISSDIVQKKYYHKEMSNSRVEAYKNKKLPRPIDVLNSALSDTNNQRKSGNIGASVVHWFRKDLRLRDNHALFAASEKARKASVPLIAIYIVSPQDFEAHLTAPIRVDFILRSLKLLRDDLAALNIPLYIETVEERNKIPERIAQLLSECEAKHLFANFEYEVDELRRDAKIVRNLSTQGVCFDVRHDSCIVQPGKVVSGTGNQYSVYTPWYRAWMAHLRANPKLLETFSAPTANSPSILSNKKFASFFDCPLPIAPANKQITEDEEKRFSTLWPAGEAEALARLDKFCSERIRAYKVKRNFPAETGTSSLSVHFAAGTLSARTAINVARQKSGTKKLDGANEGTQTWISEVAWRDFYRHVLVEWPYVWCVLIYFCFPTILGFGAPVTFITFLIIHHSHFKLKFTPFIIQFFLQFFFSRLLTLRI